VVVVGLEMRLANRAGTMNLCMPYAVIEPLMDALADQNWFSAARHRDGERHQSNIRNQLAHAPVDANAILAQTTITMRDLMDLAVGDIITTEKPVGTPSLMCVENEPKLLVELGQHKGKRALRVIRPVTHDDRF
jgi:flagellar motor switch protein FliM